MFRTCKALFLIILVLDDTIRLTKSTKGLIYTLVYQETFDHMDNFSTKGLLSICTILDQGDFDQRAFVHMQLYSFRKRGICPGCFCLDMNSYVIFWAIFFSHVPKGLHDHILWINCSNSSCHCKRVHSLMNPSFLLKKLRSQPSQNFTGGH